MGTAPSGWYPDPADARVRRHWDGSKWTGETQPAEAPAYGHYSGPAGGQSNVLLIIGIILGLLIPIGGLIIAIVLFTTGRARQGLYVILATLIGFAISLAILL